jgi:hypothetical protein
MEGYEEQGVSSRGTNVRWRGPSNKGLNKMDIVGNQQMDMENDNGEHKTENDGARRLTDMRRVIRQRQALGTGLGGGAMLLCLHWFWIVGMESL